MSGQDLDTDPHWFGSLDPDPQWGKKIDPDPHWTNADRNTANKIIQY
jgi:hypothetical protein